MDESILDTVKHLLGIEKSQTAFDNEILYNINSAFMDLYQIGFGDKPFVLEDGSEEWSDAIDNNEFFESVKMYIFQKTKISFDPPSSSFVLDSINKQLQEIEWRLYIQKEEFEKEAN